MCFCVMVVLQKEFAQMYSVCDLVFQTATCYAVEGGVGPHPLPPDYNLNDICGHQSLFVGWCKTAGEHLVWYVTYIIIYVFCEYNVQVSRLYWAYLVYPIII